MIVRRMVSADIPACVELHMDGLGTEFVTRFGRRFLRRYYRAYLESPGGLCLIAQGEDDQAPAGLLLGALDPASHYRYVVRTHGFGLAGQIALECARHPGLGVDLVRTRGMRYLRGAARNLRRGPHAGSKAAAPDPAAASGPGEAPNPGEAPDPGGEITHVVVAADRRRLGVGRALLAAAEREAASAGVLTMDLVTPLDDPGAAAFYMSAGWTRVGEVQTASGERFARFHRALGRDPSPGEPEPGGP